MPLGTEVPGHIVLDGNRAPRRKNGHSSPPFFDPCLLWPNGWMDQDTTWYGVNLGPGDTVLDGDPAPPPEKVAHQLPTFRPMSIGPVR